jgi:CDP-diacylglycerol--glycerol-3-phosphate 3-phosphatidyltransferase
MTLSNKLTILRIGLSPLFLVVFFIDHVGAKIAALLIVIVSEITDLMDGVIARKKQQVTEFGKIADPLADSISRFTCFICFLSAGLVPAWMVVVLFYREIIVATLRIFAAKNQIIIAARNSGKIKAVVQGIAMYVILIFFIISYYYPNIPLGMISYSLMFIVTVVTAWSGYDYLHGNRIILSDLQI